MPRRATVANEYRDHLYGPDDDAPRFQPCYHVFPASGEPVRMKDGTRQATVRVIGSAAHLLDVCARLEKCYGPVLVKHSTGYIDEFRDGRLTAVLSERAK
jgi:hypothetical protein